jgi:hypothetical protein
MRLLQYSESGKLSIHSFDDGAIPPYAILLDTWGADGDEVTILDPGRVSLTFPTHYVNSASYALHGIKGKAYHFQ